MSISLAMPKYVHYARVNVKTKRTHDMCMMHAMEHDYRPEPAKRLEQARSRRFKSAKSAAEFYGWKVDTYTQHENGTRGLARAAKQYAKAFKVSEGWLLTGEGKGPDDITHVPLKGRVGAGAEIYAYDNGDIDEVEAPSGASPNSIAVAVHGDSMFPAFEEGAILYYSKHLPPDAMINKRCVVQLADGRIFVKILRMGSDAGLWTLQSLNPLYPDMPDQVVEWVSPIDWIKP